MQMMMDRTKEDRADKQIDIGMLEPNDDIFWVIYLFALAMGFAQLASYSFPFPPSLAGDADVFQFS